MASPPATLENWLTPPHNKWAFTHIDQVLNTAHINKAETPSPLPSTPQDFSSFNLFHNGQPLDLPSFISRLNIDSLLILQHGKILHEHYTPPNHPSAPHILMSLTKSLTGLLLHILQSQSKLSLSDPITKYIPEVSSTPYRTTTLQQCIDMRSHIKYTDGQHPYRAATGWHPLLPSDKHRTAKQFLSNFTPDAEIDDRFEYASPNTDLLGWVIERAAGKTYAEVLEECLWKPIGAENDALMTLDSEGTARAAGGLCAAPRDLARVIQLFLTDGRSAEGVQVVPESYIQDTLHNGSKDAWQRGSFAAVYKGTGYADVAYRNGVYVDEETETMMGWGVFGQHFCVDRKSGVSMIVTASQEMGIGVEEMRLCMAGFGAVRRCLV